MISILEPIYSRGTKVAYRAKTHRYTVGFCILIVLIVLDMKPLYSNATRIAFRGKMHFLFATCLELVKQSFIA